MTESDRALVNPSELLGGAARSLAEAGESVSPDVRHLEMEHGPLGAPDAALPLDGRTQRRQQGVYYSPKDVSEALATWAVRASDENVFDPSFGGCVLLRAALARLQHLGVRDAPRRVFGTDTDGGALRAAQRLVCLGADPRQFVQCDFLTSSPEDVGGPFSVVLGNPPYVRHHVLADPMTRTARASVPDGVHLSRLASYWAYFVLHALRFVAPGGRMALILPGTFLRADYAEAVRSELQRAFASITALVLEEQVFPDAEEKSVLLLAEQRGGSPGTIHICAARREYLNIERAIRKAETWPETEQRHQWARGLFGADMLARYESLASRHGRLGSTARIGIGVVTGANDYFLVDAAMRRKMGIEDVALRPVVSRTNQLRGLWLTAADAARGLRQMFVPPSTALPPGAARYVEYGVQSGIDRGSKCAQRTPWFVPRGTVAPDTFLSCMAWRGVRLVVNRAKALCTNTLLSAHFSPQVDQASRIAYAVGTLSSIAQLSAEIEGRVCGGGLLKLEPSDARRLVVPAVRLDASEQSNLDALCRAGQWDTARELVDAHLVGEALTEHGLRALGAALARARARRCRRRR